MSAHTTDPFQDRNTRFVVRVRNHGSKGDESFKVGSPKSSRKLFNDSQNYSCIANTRNDSIYLSDTVFSGKLLNSQHMMKEDINNKFLFAETSEIYAFDKVYTESARQKEFYQDNAKPLVQYLLSGVNSIIITYGPQGAGKSYTMRGNEKNEIGVIPRFAKDLIASIEGTHFSLYLSVIQIYKEWVFDLLRGDQDIAVRNKERKYDK